MRSRHLHPGWEVLIYLTVIVIGVGFMWWGSADPSTTSCVVAH